MVSFEMTVLIQACLRLRALRVRWCAAIAILLALPAAAAAPEAFSVMSRQLGLDGQSGWQMWVNPTDSPEGAYLATLQGSQKTLTGRIKLPHTLQPGRHYVAFKMYDYNAKGNFTFSIGSSSGEVSQIPSSDSPEWYEYTGWWTAPYPIDVVAPSDTLTITLNRTTPAGTVQRYLLKGFYITRNQNEVVFADDSVIALRKTASADPTTPRRGNLLPNASFETGIGHGWGVSEATSRSFPLASLHDRTVARHGSASLRVPNLLHVVSRVVRLRGDREYTLSAWVKTASSGRVTLSIEGASVAKMPANYPAIPRFSKTFDVNRDWQRVSLTAFLPNYPTGDYQVRIAVNDPDGKFTWIDAVQFEEGKLTDFAPASAIEVGLTSDKPSNLFLDSEPVRLNLSVHNSDARAASVRVPYEVFDYLNRRVASGSRDVSVAANSTWRGTIDLGTSRRGIFRVVLWADQYNHSREEVIYGVVPQPRTTGIDTASLMGIHSEFSDFQFEVLQKLGVKWNRASSPSRAFRWSTLEPTEGVFNWSPEDVTLGSRYGISVLGTLGLYWPSWADEGGKPNLDKWEKFVATVVNRYKSQVKYWEVWNEPNWQMPAEHYAQMLKRAIAAIVRTDPTAKIVGLGGVASHEWSASVLNALTASERASLHAVATHIYPKAKGLEYHNYRTRVQDVFNLPVWNTEAGSWCRGSYAAENSNFLQADSYAMPHNATERFEQGSRSRAALAAQGFLHHVGSGMSTYFYYDARIYVGPGLHGGHPTFFEHDDTIRAKGIAYAVLGRLFDHSRGLGDISPNSAAHIYLFDRGGTPLLALWTPDESRRALKINLPASQYTVYDLMGNPVEISGGEIPFNSIPVYVEGKGISVSTLRAAVQNGSVTTRPDVTPPNLSMVIHPTGPTPEQPLKLRWLAIDADATPSAGNPDAIQYSWILRGFDTEWSPWTAQAFVDYNDVPAGTYQFEVRARDESGNMTSVSVPIVTTGPSRPRNVQAHATAD